MQQAAKRMIRGTGTPWGHMSQGQEPLGDVTELMHGDKQAHPPTSHSCGSHLQPKPQLPGCQRQDPGTGLGTTCWGSDAAPTANVSTRGQAGTEQHSGSLRESPELGSKRRAAPHPPQQVPQDPAACQDSQCQPGRAREDAGPRGQHGAPGRPRLPARRSPALGTHITTTERKSREKRGVWLCCSHYY